MMTPEMFVKLHFPSGGRLPEHESCKSDCVIRYSPSSCFPRLPLKCFDDSNSNQPSDFRYLFLSFSVQKDVLLCSARQVSFFCARKILHNHFFLIVYEYLVCYHHPLRPSNNHHETAFLPGNSAPTARERPKVVRQGYSASNMHPPGLRRPHSLRPRHSPHKSKF